MRGEAKSAVLLFLLAILPFAPTLWAGFLNWDDDLYLTENPAVTSSEGWRMLASEWRTNANTYPVVLAAFRFEHRLWGFHPAGYHAVNLLLHGMVTVLLFRVFRSLEIEPGIAFATAALFAVHPMQTATVAWVSEQKSLLGALFLLAGMWVCWGWGREHDPSPKGEAAISLPEGGKAKSLPPPGGDLEGGDCRGSIGQAKETFTLAASPPSVPPEGGEEKSLPEGGKAKSLPPPGGDLEGGSGERSTTESSKESSRAHRLRLWASLPLLLLAYLSKSSLVVFPLVLWWTDRLRKQTWKPSPLVFAHFLLAACLGWIYAGRETGPEIAWLDRLVLVPRCLAHYLFAFFLPFHRSGVYPTWPLGWGEWATCLSVLACVLILAVLLLSRRNLTGEEVWGLIWFIVFIAPSLGLLRFGYQKHSYVSDHLAYLSLAGLFLFVVVLFDRLLKAKPRAGKAVLVMVLGLSAALSFTGSFHWLSSERFWTWTLERNPNSWVAHQNLATVLDSENHLEEALGHYTRSVELDPTDPIGWINLGRIRIKVEDYPGALEALEKARTLNPNYPQIESLEREARRRARGNEIPR